MFRKAQHDIPQLNTASLPDLIFTVLFFFMIVTHMRTEDPKVHYTLPQGNSLVSLKQKQALLSIVVGKDIHAKPSQNKEQMVIEINGERLPLTELQPYIEAQRKKISNANQPLLTALIKADEHTPMQLISAIRTTLQTAKVQHVFYVANTSKKKQ